MDHVSPHERNALKRMGPVRKLDAHKIKLFHGVSPNFVRVHGTYRDRARIECLSDTAY